MSDYTITSETPTSRTLLVNTAQGQYPVVLTTLSERAIDYVEVNDLGEEVVMTRFEKMTWTETCDQAARQIIAALGAA